MDAQRTPDELTAENELICERLLGWSKAQWFGGWAGNWWDRPDGGMCAGTPSFATWAEAGLILDALIASGVYTSVHHGESGDQWKVVLHWRRYEEMTCQFANQGPLAIRAAALEYVRRLP